MSTGRCPGFCSETDDGDDPYTQGHLSYQSSYGWTTERDDYCQGGAYPGLKEYYCRDVNSFTGVLYPDSEGCNCVDGACKPTVDPCTDKDGGLNYNVTGTVTLHNGTQYTDYCVVGNNNVREFYCQDNDVDYVYYATGVEPNDSLYKEIKQIGTIQVEKIGDARKPETVMEAIARGYKMGNSI